LLCVIDSKVHLCEVKSSGRDIQLDPLAGIAKRIRPDVVTLAVMEQKTQRLVSKSNCLRNTLSAENISVELMTLDEDDYSDSSILPICG